MRVCNPRSIHSATIAILFALLINGTVISDVLAENSSTQRTVLITGSNRGIGLEFVRQYAASGWRVIATCRSPARAEELNALAKNNPAVLIEELDVTDQADIDRLQAKYSDQPLELLIIL